MPGLSLQTDAFVLLRKPAADKFQSFTVFSAEHGGLLCLKRISSKAATATSAPDLFDELHLQLENSSQGGAWFIKEARVLEHHQAIGRSYEALAAASHFAALIARNPVHEESRRPVYALLRQAFAAFATAAPPELVLFKSLYCFARDEGYPVKQDWAEGLPDELHLTAVRLLNSPLSDLTGQDARAVAPLQTRLEAWLAGHTEILLP
jgi:recombinational DNA repair protein (RecF pathway)